jgi:hypothetical protein
MYSQTGLREGNIYCVQEPFLCKVTYPVQG